MYIRATKTHTKGGKTAKSFRLSRSVRIGDQVRQETLLNLGVDYPVPKERWRDVVLVTEVLLAGRRPMLSVPPDIEAAAEDLVRRLRAVGLGPPEPERSEREALRWLREDSAALELLDLDRGKALSLQKLYRTGDALWRLRRALQAGLFHRERELLELPDTIVFYDLTNTWYTGRSDQELLRFGRSKEGRKPPAGNAGVVAGWCGVPAGVRGSGGGRVGAGDAGGGDGAVRGGVGRGRRAEADGDRGRGDRDGGEHRLASGAGLRLDLREPGDAAGAAGGGRRTSG